MDELPDWLQQLWELDSSVARKAEKHYISLITYIEKGFSTWAHLNGWEYHNEIKGRWVNKHTKQDVSTPELVEICTKTLRNG